MSFKDIKLTTNISHGMRARKSTIFEENKIHRSNLELVEKAYDEVETQRDEAINQRNKALKDLSDTKAELVRKENSIRTLEKRHQDELADLNKDTVSLRIKSNSLESQLESLTESFDSHVADIIKTKQKLYLRVTESEASVKTWRFAAIILFCITAATVFLATS